MTRSAGIVWLASRPAQCGVWTTDAETGRAGVSCHGDWTAWTPPGSGKVGSKFSMDATTLASWIGDARQELVFEGDVTMDPTALRAALDACLLTESEMGGSQTSGEASSRGADLDIFCFSPWPERDAHLASLGVHAGGRGSRAIAMAAAKKGAWSGLWDVTEGVANMRVSGGGGDGGGGEPVAKKFTGAASLGFGGAAGVRVPEAFVPRPGASRSGSFPTARATSGPRCPAWSAGPRGGSATIGTRRAPTAAATPSRTITTSARTRSTGDGSSGSGDWSTTWWRTGGASVAS